MDEYSIRHRAGLVLWSDTPAKTDSLVLSMPHSTGRPLLLVHLAKPSLRQVWAWLPGSYSAEWGDSLQVNCTRIRNSLGKVHSLVVRHSLKAVFKLSQVFLKEYHVQVIHRRLGREQNFLYLCRTEIFRVKLVDVPVSQNVSGLLPALYVTWHDVLSGTPEHVCSGSSSSPLYLPRLMLGREAGEVTAEKYIMLFWTYFWKMKQYSGTFSPVQCPSDWINTSDWQQ